MPSKSKRQARLMAGAAHNPAFAKKVGVPGKVAKEFKADKGTGILKGPVHQRAKEMSQAKRDISMLKRKRMV